MRFSCLVRPTAMAILSAAILGGLSVTPAAAQRGRPSAAQIKALQQQQTNYYGAQLVLQKRQKDIYAKYDLNSDGKLDSKEKPPYDRYWREVRSGKQPNPLDPATVTQPEIDAAVKSAQATTQPNQQGNQPAAKKPNTN
jgi:type II secretory pathway pseudopilin PulG